MPFLTCPTGELYYETHGTGPALIFAHGLGGNHLSWWQQIPHFRARYTCITFAHRGFAPSQDQSGDGPFAFADDLAALIDHLGFSQVRLVAQSMGGWTCVGYALRQPQRVRALVMCDTTGSLTHPQIDAAFAARTGAEAELFARGIHPAAGARMAAEQPALHFLYTEIDALSYALDKPAVRAKLMRLRTTPVEALAQLQIPMLCISGAEDIVISPSAVEAMSSLIPSARLARVPAAGHSVYFERPQIFNQLVDDFLREIDGDSRM